ncbi:MAG: lactate dehydrogenase [Spirochaetae bacterium HGW-Spirochaetae-4]|jgi:ureidoglycolate dehydrogenase (NAD+)|nr:MAG: hypothetical protein A2Y31_12750 [Spirochaetes bacterium GWC2_52_13]PKL12751.1 MAG: lactate dehydrogenase [Spirochaetae bacterium HGW-Spirochaetae-8]PKL20145.1 MAG: lactate dehydrogenase [Spirochaetae bacterium HGW-Spirochaetae-4]HCG62530.1 lactate dehydrogenase [Sphaerochaeta sp.]HCS36904.1 lactate dehydrogenase [Sphaerochaeta sp.]
MSAQNVIIKEETLRELIIKKMEGAGMPQADAKIVADVLVYADLRGIHSHGALRVEHYTKRIKAGGMNLHPALKVNRIKGSIALVDAEGGMGAVTMRYAMEEAIKIARSEGVCIMGLKNNSHCGALAYYSNMAIQADMAALVTVNTDSVVAPFGGKTKFLGTNPFSFGFPGVVQNILLDMSTSEVAFGKIFYAQEKNIPIPKGWAVDAEGNPCTDPHKAVSLYPFGGAKGYGINIMNEALTGLMIGGVFGPYLKLMYGDYESYRDLSGFMMVIDPSVFGEGYKERTQQMIDELHAQEPAPGFDKVLIPGELEHMKMEASKVDGIEIAKSIVDFLSA